MAVKRGLLDRGPGQRGQGLSVSAIRFYEKKGLDHTRIEMPAIKAPL